MKTNVLNQGDIGTGKTRALITLLPTYVDERGDIHEGAGVAPFLISMEAGSEATLGRNLCGAPRHGDHVIHHHHIPAINVPFETLASYIELANSIPYDTLLKTEDPNKRQYRQAIELCDATRDFVCDHCGEHFGAVREWDDSRAIIIDSLTGLTKAFTMNVIGGKPFPSLPQVGGIMALIEGFLDNYWSATQCSAILLAHIDRENDPLSGMSKITAHTIGQKLAPRLVKKPDEVITSYVGEDGRYYWSNALIAGNEVQKRRRLPLSATLEPNYRQLFV